MASYAHIPLNATIELNGPFVGTIQRLKRICCKCLDRVPVFYIGSDGACLDCYMAAQIPAQTNPARRVAHAR